MPIYEFSCNQCGCHFEKLVRSSGTEIACPECGTKEISRLMSTFAASVGGKMITGHNCSGCSSTGCSTCKSN